MDAGIPSRVDVNDSHVRFRPDALLVSRVLREGRRYLPRESSSSQPPTDLRIDAAATPQMSEDLTALIS